MNWLSIMKVFDISYLFLEGEDQVVVDFPTEDTIIVQRDDSTKNRFEFDRTFTPESQQQEVFDQVEPLIVSCMDGYKVSIVDLKTILVIIGHLGMYFCLWTNWIRKNFHNGR